MLEVASLKGNWFALEAEEGHALAVNTDGTGPLDNFLLFAFGTVWEEILPEIFFVLAVDQRVIDVTKQTDGPLFVCSHLHWVLQACFTESNETLMIHEEWLFLFWFFAAAHTSCWFLGHHNLFLIWVGLISFNFDQGVIFKTCHITVHIKIFTRNTIIFTTA